MLSHSWNRGRALSAAVLVLLLLACFLWLGPSGRAAAKPGDQRAAEGRDRVGEGREIFRFDTFGDEQQWTDRLRMHEVIESAVDPLTALALGLKVDVDAL